MKNASMSLSLIRLAFAKSQGARNQALRAYRRLNTLGMQGLTTGWHFYLLAHVPGWSVWMISLVCSL